MKQLGEAKIFLGMEIEQNKRKAEVRLSQRKYIKKVLQRFGM